MGGVTVDRQAATAATNALAPAATMASESASRLETLAVAQDSSKWGTEVGPDVFRRQYSEGLWQLRDDLKTMQERLGSYVTGVREAIKAFDAADGDAAAQQALSQAQLEQQQREVAVAPVTPQQAV